MRCFSRNWPKIVSDFADLLKQNSHFHVQFARRIRKVKQQTGDFGYGYTDFVIDKFSELDDDLVNELV